MGFYEGHAFIREQVESICAQTDVDLSLFIFDDASPKSLDLGAFNGLDKCVDKVSIIPREHNLGFQMNFLMGLKEIPGGFDYYAFSDQDDVWHPNKLSRAIAKLSQLGDANSALYGARTEIWNETLTQCVGLSPHFKKAPSFGNALVQSIAGGNTMVMTPRCRDLITEANYDTRPVSHDWWCYQLATGAGAEFVYDEWPCLKYRQHSRNIIGSNRGWTARLARLRRLLAGDFRRWNNQNIAALENNIAILAKHEKVTFDRFRKLRGAGFFARSLLPWSGGIVRQTTLSQLGLIFGLIAGRV